jgi:hypothetical protein
MKYLFFIISLLFVVAGFGQSTTNQPYFAARASVSDAASDQGGGKYRITATITDESAVYDGTDITVTDSTFFYICPSPVANDDFDVYRIDSVVAAFAGQVTVDVQDYQNTGRAPRTGNNLIVQRTQDSLFAYVAGASDPLNQAIQQWNIKRIEELETGGGAADGNGLIDSLPAGNVSIDADGNDLIFDNLGAYEVEGNAGVNPYNILGAGSELTFRGDLRVQDIDVTNLSAGDSLVYLLASFTGDGLFMHIDSFMNLVSTRAISGTANTYSIFQSGGGLAEGSLSEEDGAIVTTTGVKQNTSTQSATCLVVEGGDFSNNGTNTGAIEITLPETVYGTQSSLTFTLTTFNVSVVDRANAVTNFVVSVMANGDLTSFSEPTSVFSVGNTIFNIQYRVGFEDSKLKIWIGDLSTDWGNAISVSIFNVHMYSYNAPATFQCSDWAVSLESTGFGTVEKQSVVNPQKTSFKDQYLGPGISNVFHDLAPILTANYGGTGVYAHEITLPAATANLTGNISFSVYGFLNFVSLEKIRHFQITASYSYSTRNFSDVTVNWIGGPPPNVNFRFGDDGTNGKIWIGDLGTGRAGQFVCLYDLTAIYLSPEAFADFSLNPWSAGKESVAYDNVDVTITGPSEYEIPIVSGNDGWTYSSSAGLAMKIPGGTTAQRPTGAVGLMYYNTDLDGVEVHDGTNWKLLISDHGSASDTTDGSGDITVSHNLGTDSITCTVTVVGTTPYNYTIHSKTSTTFKIRFFTTGSSPTAVTSTAVTADWIARKQ